MREQMERRLEELRQELEVGQRALAEAEARVGGLRASMLRIGGAAQVLEELLAEEAPPATDERSERPLRRAAGA